MSRWVPLLLLVAACGGPLEDEDQADDLKGSFSLSTSSATVIAPAPAVVVSLKDSTAAGHGFAVKCTHDVTATPASGKVTKARPAKITVRGGSVSATCKFTSTSGSTSAATFTLHVNAFSVALSPATQTMAPGAKAAYAVTTAGSGQIALSFGGLPGGVTGTFSPATITAGQSSTLTLTAARSAPDESRSFQVNGTEGTKTFGASAIIDVLRP